MARFFGDVTVRALVPLILCSALGGVLFVIGNSFTEPVRPGPIVPTIRCCAATT